MKEAFLTHLTLPSMFDKPSPKNAFSIASPQEEPEDIFSNIDPMERSGSDAKIESAAVGAPTATPVVSPTLPVNLPSLDEVLKETRSSASSKSPVPPSPSDSQLTGQVWKKKLFLVPIIIVVIAVVVGAGYFVYVKYFQSKSVFSTDVSNTTTVEPSVNQNVNGSETRTSGENTNTTPETAREETGAPSDLDNDGLTDEEEKDLGTNPRFHDTDSDGLFDREEVRLYKSDPKNRDTDGDGYVDGEEVKQGYNPTGPGKLFEIPK